MSIWKFCFFGLLHFQSFEIELLHLFRGGPHLDTVIWVDFQVTRILSRLIFLHFGKEHHHHKVTFVDYSFVQRI